MHSKSASGHVSGVELGALRSPRKASFDVGAIAAFVSPELAPHFLPRKTLQARRLTQQRLSVCHFGHYARRGEEGTCGQLVEVKPIGQLYSVGLHFGQILNGHVLPGSLCGHQHQQKHTHNVSVVESHGRRTCEASAKTDHLQLIPKFQQI